MPKTNLTTIPQLKEKTKHFTTIEQYQRVLEKLDIEQGDKAVMSTKRSFLIQSILSFRNDLKEYNDLNIYNRGVQLEILTAQQALDLPEHRADSKEKEDAKKGKHRYEIKAFTNNNACIGYKTMQEWECIGLTKNMILTFEDRVFQIPKTKWSELQKLLEFKLDYSKAGVRTYKIRAIKKNYKIVNKFMKGKCKTLDLTV